MERLHLDPTNPDPAVLQQAGDILRRGGVIIYPSDTCYGLGADVRNALARERIGRMKQREESKKYSVIAKDIELIERIAIVDEVQLAILKHYLPGQYTFVLLSADLSILNSNTIGVRMPKNLVTQGIANAFGSPFISTSANLGGQPTLYSYDQLQEDFLQLIDPDDLPNLILDAGILPHNPPSTVVDLTATPPAILRQGAVPFVWPLPQ
ncbi:MAG: L-threonylcarbamoyladenylate synthase [Patescibacteria group bacterium]